MKVAIVGSRSFNDYGTLKAVIEMTCQTYGIEIDTIVSGGARGTDRLGEMFAKEKGYETLIFPADWDKYGKRAGFIRNVEIIDNCDACIAFWDGESHGTKHDIELCQEKNKPCYVYRFDQQQNNTEK